MALVRNAANMIRKGRVGDATYYVSKGQQVVRQARNDSNYGESARRSENQQVRRVMWANLVNFYKASATWMPAAFESKKRSQTDYNKFMQVNMNSSRIALTKDQAAAGACVVDAYLVTQGSLPSVEINQTTNAWYTNIGIGNLTIGAATTNAELTAAMEANNANIQEGMQISFVSYQQSLDAMGMPRVICRLYEITLSRTSTDLVRDYLPEFCSQSVEGNLGTSADISIGAFAYIVSDKRAGQVRVSTQQLITKNQTLIEQYTNGEHVRAAMLSYGIDSEVILSPTGTNAQTPEGQPIYVESVDMDGDTFTAGMTSPWTQDLEDTDGTITLSTSPGVAVSLVSIIDASGSRYAGTNVSITGQDVQFKFPTPMTGNRHITRISVTFANGNIYGINFSVPGAAPGDL